ncbi:MAG: DUF134 domain-containing protein [Oscillospiraceae bacterium]|nr:DUF134 domain-containing protein [Oscillospiraceae bacterium]
MPRPQRCRKVCSEPEYSMFYPAGFASGDTVTLTVDECEVIRLVDLEKLTHSQAAELMEISRTTATEIYNIAREKIAECIVNGRPLAVSGGSYVLCGGGKCCGCPRGEGCSKVKSKGNGIMRIAVTFDNGKIFQHFGHTQFFKFYDVTDGKVTGSEVMAAPESGHGALAGFLKENGTDVLICGGIGGGAQNALAAAGIKLYGGADGDADEAVNALLNGSLSYDPFVMCSHHDHGEGHNCGSHSCTK